MRTNQFARIKSHAARLLPKLGLSFSAFGRRLKKPARDRQRCACRPQRHINLHEAARAMSCVALVLSHCGSAQAYTALVAFGDSYTDTGRLPSSPPNYWDGRFSNGPLWIEYLSQTLGFAYDPANNFAVSGTESNELGLEINNFA